jgi:hypothetical protein
VSTCKQCAVSADIFAQNVKNWGFDAAMTKILPSVLEHTYCEYKDCYCQHTIDRIEYARD